MRSIIKFHIHHIMIKFMIMMFADDIVFVEENLEDINNRVDKSP